MLHNTDYSFSFKEILYIVIYFSLNGKNRLKISVINLFIESKLITVNLVQSANLFSQKF